jgi:hypothetical protein
MIFHVKLTAVLPISTEGPGQVRGSYPCKRDDGTWMWMELY